VQGLARERHVIVCGYGRTGQHLGRFLEREGIGFVALDLDPDRVREAAVAGEPVVYGDSSRPETLVAAGVNRASALVISFADTPAALRTLARAHEISPSLPVIVRTRDDADFVFARLSDQPWYDDVDGSDFPLVWDVDPDGPGFEFRDLSRLYRVVLCDYDPTTGDEDMIETEAFTFGEFAPDEADGVEDSIVLTGIDGGSEVAVRLRVVYGS